MDESIPSISSGTVGSRFVSENEIDSAKAKRDEQWKAAYARLGQEPPPQPVEDVYDGRSLAEKLAANKAAKQEEWEEKTKLANQFRALEEDEVLFLDSIVNEQRAEERKRQQQDAEDVEGFKQAVAARHALSHKPEIPKAALTSSATVPTASTSKGKLQTVAGSKKGPKNVLKGVIVKKKKPPLASETSRSQPKLPQLATDSPHQAGETQGAAKRRKVSEGSPP